MKSCMVFAVSGLLLGAGLVNGSERIVGQVSPAQRDYSFIVSQFNDSLCITAPSTEEAPAFLTLEPCDFEAVSPRQLWRINQEDGRIQSAAILHGNDRCIIIDRGMRMVPGTRLKLTNCDDPNQEFIYDEGVTDWIISDDSQDYCITNNGVGIDAGDFVVVRPCTSEMRFRWILQAQDNKKSTVLYSTTS